MDKKEIGRIIKARRTALNVKQQDVADLAGVGINTLVAIERGQGNAKIDTLLSVLQILGLDLSIGMDSPLPHQL